MSRVWPGPVSPMLAVEAPGPFDSPEFGFEIKWDGLRCIAFIEPGRTRLQSRGHRDLTSRYPALSGLGALLRGHHRAVLDGELLGLAGGRPSFQAALRVAGATVLMGFDLLHLDGRDLLDLPLETRQHLLEQAFRFEGGLLRSTRLAGPGTRCYAAAREQGLEGIMAKRLSSRYRPGVRSPDWQKLVVRRTMACVVLGITAGSVPVPLGGRVLGFGSAAVGVRAPGGGAWAYLGNVGSGWDQRTLRSALAGLRPAAEPAWLPGAAPPPDLAARTTWVEPGLEAEVAYRERLPGGALRHPSLVGIRPGSVPGRPCRSE